MNEVCDYEFQGLESEVSSIWDRNAEFWDNRMGDGNRWHRELIAPNQERFLGLREGETVLDVACGNGNFARRMAELGAEVVGFDVSEKMIERARTHGPSGPGRIEYRVIDASDGEAVLSLGRRRFDAAVCTMAMMDMPKISPMLSALGHVLKPGGRFVFSVLHPCFNSTSTRFVLEESERGGVVEHEYSLRISEYIEPVQSMGLAIAGQPEPHYYFHRPTSALFGACFDAGFMLDGIAEPTFRSPETADEGRANPMWWANHAAIPPALIARMRLTGPQSTVVGQLIPCDW